MDSVDDGVINLTKEYRRAADFRKKNIFSDSNLGYVDVMGSDRAQKNLHTQI